MKYTTTFSLNPKHSVQKTVQWPGGSETSEKREGELNHSLLIILPLLHISMVIPSLFSLSLTWPWPFMLICAKAQTLVTLLSHLTESWYVGLDEVGQSQNPSPSEYTWPQWTEENSSINSSTFWPIHQRCWIHWKVQLLNYLKHTWAFLSLPPSSGGRQNCHVGAFNISLDIMTLHFRNVLMQFVLSTVI